MKRVCAALAVASLLILPAEAGGLDLGEEEFQLAEFETQAETYLDGMDISLENDWEDNLAALVDTGTEELFGIVKKAVRSSVLLLSIALFCGIGEITVGEKGSGLVRIVPLVGALAVSAVSVADVHSLMGMGVTSVEKLTSFSNVLLPVVASLTAATGAVTGAAARQMAAVLFSDLLLNVINSVLIPLVYGYIAASIAWAATGNGGLKRVAALFKWAATTLLIVLLMAYVAYLSVNGIITGSADAAAIKAAKFAISTAVPVVGGILSDASESILSAAGVLKSSVGVFGMVAVLALCLVPFLQLAVHYLAYKFVAAVAATVGGSSVTGLIESLGTSFGLILGMMGAGALLLLVSLVSSITMVAA